MPEHARTDLDVLVLGEVLVEIAGREPLAERVAATVDFSGDALNVACAAASAGARTALLARIPNDELGDAIVAKLRRLGVRTDTVIRGAGQHGLYLSHGDPLGQREFTYVRRGSFGSTLQPGDLDPDLLATTAVVTASGIATAISDSVAALVERAAVGARRFVYDPNLRLRLTTAARAAATLARLAPHCAVVTPSWPTEAEALLGLPPGSGETTVVDRMRALGARDVVVTRGALGSLVASGRRPHRRAGGARTAGRRPDRGRRQHDRDALRPPRRRRRPRRCGAARCRRRLVERRCPRGDRPCPHPRPDPRPPALPPPTLANQGVSS